MDLRLTRRWRWVQRRLGRRGTALVLFGTVWLLQALHLALAYQPTPPVSRALLHEQLPTWVRVLLWGGTGAVAIAFAWKRSPGADTPGFLALVMLPLERTLSYLLGWCWWVLAGPGEGFRLGLSAALTWLCITGVIMLIAGWMEPPATLRTERAGRRE